MIDLTEHRAQGHCDYLIPEQGWLAEDYVPEHYCPAYASGNDGLCVAHRDILRDQSKSTDMKGLLARHRLAGVNRIVMTPG